MSPETPLSVVFKKLVDSPIFNGREPKSLHDRGTDGYTPLHAAVLLNDLTSIQILLDAGANPNAPGKNWDTALHVAVQNENIECVQLLLAHAASKDKLNHDDLSPEFLAQKSNNLRLKETILNSQNKQLTPEVANILKEMEDAGCDSLLGIKVTDVNARGSLGDTPLHVAVVWGIDAMRILLEAGANPNLPGEYDFTPLHRAVTPGNYDMVRLLLEYGASKDLLNEWGFTPADYAKKSGDSHLVEIVCGK